ncbi:MBL fold metallo-hydrolase [Dactylosporangium sp. NPDC050588]|uniref:MBL fold metallo-hydrolase n=1 Tax=Dactylosporangium sp. NPDC050588 TaxID=3157211 RepID=UPI0033D73F6D
MRRIVDGVWEIAFGYVHAHLIEVDDGLVLVDTGLPHRAGKLGVAVRATGHDLADVHTILMTHQHADHTGSLADLRQRTGARVVAHRQDAPVITGERPAPVHHWLLRLSARFLRAEPAPVDRTLEGDGPTGVSGITAVHTPGHTPGHVSFLLDRGGGVLFAGDAATAMLGRVRASPKVTNADHAVAVRSAARLAELDFQVAVFGHGAAVRGDAVSRFRDFAARLR